MVVWGCVGRRRLYGTVGGLGVCMGLCGLYGIVRGCSGLYKAMWAVGDCMKL